MDKDDLDILAAIVRSPMLAPSVSALATALDYPSRSTLYRVIDGSAGESAAYGLLERLIETFELSKEAINDMYEVIVREEYLRACLTSEFMQSAARRRARDIVVAFVTHGFSAFSVSFRQGPLTELMRLETDRPEMFYAVLGYYYIRETGVNVYNPRRDFFEYCGAIMESLGDELMEIYPENDAAISVVGLISRTEFYDSSPRVLWTLIDPLGTMLRFFARPGDGYQSLGEAIILEELAERTYWRGMDERRTLLLLQPVAGPKPGSGNYKLFKIDATRAAAEFIGVILILDEDTLTINIPVRGIYRFGGYELDEETLTLTWERRDDDPTGAGNRWMRLDPRRSQTLRALDRRLTDEQLDRSHLGALGADLMPGYEIDDVVLTRSHMRLCLRSGDVYSIALDEFDFMSGLLPSEPVRIIRMEEDGELLVHWPRIMICVSLEKFTKIGATRAGD